MGSRCPRIHGHHSRRPRNVPVPRRTGAAASQQSDAGALAVLLGALSGLAIAVALGYGFYRGTRRMNLAVFFRWTGIVLVFVAAGLVGSAVHEFAEIGAIPFGTQRRST